MLILFTNMQVSPTAFTGTIESCNVFNEWVDWKTDILWKQYLNSNDISNNWRAQMFELWRIGRKRLGVMCGIELWEKLLTMDKYSTLYLYWLINTNHLRHLFVDEIEDCANKIMIIYGLRCKRFDNVFFDKNQLHELNRDILTYSKQIQDTWEKLQYACILEKDEASTFLVGSLGHRDLIRGSKRLFRFLVMDGRIFDNLDIINQIKRWMTNNDKIKPLPKLKKPKTTLHDTTIFNQQMIHHIIPFLIVKDYVAFAKCCIRLHEILTGTDSVLLLNDFKIFISNVAKASKYDKSCSSNIYWQIAKGYYESSSESYSNSFGGYTVNINNGCILYKGEYWNTRIFSETNFKFLWNTVICKDNQCTSWGASLQNKVLYFVYEDVASHNNINIHDGVPILFNADTLIIYRTSLSKYKCSNILCDLHCDKIIFWESDMDIKDSFPERLFFREITKVQKKQFIFINTCNYRLMWYNLVQLAVQCYGWVYIKELWILSRIGQSDAYTNDFLNEITSDKNLVNIEDIHLIFIAQTSNFRAERALFSQNVIDWCIKNVDKINNICQIKQMVFTVILINENDSNGKKIIAGHSFDIKKAMGCFAALIPHIIKWRQLVYNNKCNEFKTYIQEWNSFCKTLFV